MSPATRYEFENIPAYLRERDQWVCWKYETRDGKPTKVPYHWKGGPASSTDPSTWASFGLAALALVGDSGFNGIGYMVAPDEPLVMFDFDRVIDAATGALNPLAAAMVKTLDSYTETTPSGTGLHVYAFGAKPGTRSRTTVAEGTEDEFGFEVYDHARYLTFTGWHWDGTPATVETREAEVAEVYRRVFAEVEKPETALRRLHGAPVLTDEQVLTACRAAANAAKFTTLYGGDGSAYPGPSEADYALIGMLRFYTQDPEQIERLMRSSKLARDKWDDRRGEGTYLSYSIATALEGDFETYRGPAATTPSGSAPTQATGELVRWRGGRELDTTPISYLVEDMIPNGMLGALGGKDGRGKTLLGLEIARCVLTGDKLFGRFAVKQGKVFAMLLDDPEFLVSDRLKAMGILDHPNLKIATERDVDMTDPTKMLAYLAEQLPTLEPTFVLIDALYLFVPDRGTDQANNSGAMKPIMVAFDKVANQTHATVAVVCHDNKAGSDFAGSRVIRQMLKWGLRLILPMEFEDDPEGGVETPDRVLQLNKLKTGKPTSWHLRLDGPGTWDYQGTGKEYRAAQLQAQVIEYLREAGPRTGHEIAKGIRKRPAAVIEACKTLIAADRVRTQYRPKTHGGDDAIVYVAGR